MGIGGVFAANHAIGSSLNTSAQQSGNSLVAHQVGGLTDPLNPDQFDHSCSTCRSSATAWSAA